VDKRPTPLFFACEQAIGQYGLIRANVWRLYLESAFCNMPGSFEPAFSGISIMKTYSAKPETVKRDWYIVDATDKVLGRLATELARRLRGKHKPDFTPHVDNGDYIVVINAGKVAVTGNKETDKQYHSYSGYQSGLKTISLKDLRARQPERIIETAVRGMLPKGPLGRSLIRKLKVYAGDKHEHAAQQPKVLEIK